MFSKVKKEKEVLFVRIILKRLSVAVLSVLKVLVQQIDVCRRSVHCATGLL